MFATIITAFIYVNREIIRDSCLPPILFAHGWHSRWRWLVFLSEGKPVYRDRLLRTGSKSLYAFRRLWPPERCGPIILGSNPRIECYIACVSIWRIVPRPRVESPNCQPPFETDPQCKSPPNPAPSGKPTSCSSPPWSSPTSSNPCPARSTASTSANCSAPRL